MIHVTRTIHPVGQGLFCTETFSDEHNQPQFSVAYDCGSFNQKVLSREIQNAFSNGSTIDVVFISHFHSDHICGIPELIKQNANIKIVMPQLSKALLVEAIIYNNFYSTEENANAVETNEMLIKWHFHGDSIENLCTIASSDSPINEETTCKITNLPHSMSKVVPMHYKDVWEYVPFCFFNQQFADELLEVLTKDDVFGTYFASFTEDNIRKFVEDVATNGKLSTILNSLYNHCGGFRANANANEYSMPVYSGPVMNAPISIDCSSHCDYMCNKPYHAHCHAHCHVFCDIDCCAPDPLCGSLASCLYTGDFNANFKKSYYDSMERFYHLNHRWERIKMIQVPHHGSKDSHNIDLYQNRCWAFISCGLQNQYNHPHGACVADIFNTRCHCSIVNERCQPLKIEMLIH